MAVLAHSVVNVMAIGLGLMDWMPIVSVSRMGTYVNAVGALLGVSALVGFLVVFGRQIAMIPAVGSWFFGVHGSLATMLAKVSLSESGVGFPDEPRR
jgi:hypothetical protein